MVFGSKVNLIASNLLRIRSKFSTIHGIPEIYVPPIYDKTKEEFLKNVKNISDRLTKSELVQKLRVAKGFYTLEMAPPASSGEMKVYDYINNYIEATFRQMQDELKALVAFFKSKSFMNVTINDAWLFFLVATEVGLWFYLGETIGKWHIVGYKV